MNKKNIISIISASLFFGAMWGLIEATLGYMIHLLPVFSTGLSGSILFPIGFYIMYMSYEKTKRIETVLFVGLVAAMIKLSDFLLPLIHPALILPLVKIISPALFILLEAGSVFVVLYMVKGNALKLNIIHALISSFSWRFLFVIYQYILFTTGLSRMFINAGFVNLLRFMIIETIINTIIITGFMMLLKKSKQKTDHIEYVPNFSDRAIPITISIVLFFSSVAVNILLKLGL